MSANGKYSTQENVNEAYWRDLGVRFDALNEMSSQRKEEHFKSILDALSGEDLIELAAVASIPLTDKESKEQIQEDLLAASEAERDLLIYLRDFQNRRKKAINYYYEHNSSPNEYITPFARLRHIYAQGTSHLFSIYTYHLWDVRGSGDTFILSMGISKQLSRQIATEAGFERTLQDKLFYASGEKNNYRIFSFSIVGDHRYIVLLYKQVNDTSIPDFKEAVRNQEVSTLLFELNTVAKTLEIKSASHTEVRAIREYAEMTLKDVFEPVKPEIFKSYNKNVFLESILNGKTASGKSVDDFLVEKVVFRGSPLKNSPEVTLQLKNIDIWPSVIEAHYQGSVDVKSIKDLASLSFKSVGTSRTIRSRVMENGNVVFTMDNSRMDREKLEAIKEKFKLKFGIPLYQEISNEQFEDGKADLIDYVMGQSDPGKHTEYDVKELHDRLVLDKLLEVKIERMAVCESGLHTVKLNDDEVPAECVSCETEMHLHLIKTVEISLKNVKKRVKQLLDLWCGGEQWALLPDGIMTHSGIKHPVFKVERKSDYKRLQILVIDRTINATLLEKLCKMLTPTIIVAVGQQAKFVERFSRDCVQLIPFGKLHVLQDHESERFFNEVYASLELREKAYVASAANKAHHSILKTLCEPSDIEEAYGSSDLEDDAYAIIKDMFPNAVKWGKEQSGKAVPEGVFTISYLPQKGSAPTLKNLAFSYDAKFTRDNVGYPLGIEEQRKASDYVRLLNDSDLISSYGNKRELSAHVFIYNRFSEAQIVGMKNYFEEHLSDLYTAIPVFIKTDVLAHLHANYLEFHEHVANAKNYFLGWMINVLLNKDGIVTREHIDGIFANLARKSNWETEIIDMPLLTQEITKKNAI
ncbi:hypothetical protein MKY64_07935 [Paenibacillus sp. FSL R7-0210]|uniref:hypothetical protein n=1 Tax=Paenibacillus sp. FSL R7-0210 TaxID=2921676 RepID=UPI0030F53C05